MRIGTVCAELFGAFWCLQKYVLQHCVAGDEEDCVEQLNLVRLFVASVQRARPSPPQRILRESSEATNQARNMPDQAHSEKFSEASNQNSDTRQ